MSKEKKIKFPATCVVHWATGPVNVCEGHANGLVNLGGFLGAHVPVTKLEEEAECINCINESK
nr:hypothetical protein [Nanoarchaeota archaeon]